MKLKIISIVLTVTVITIMWNFSPKQQYLSRPEVDTVCARVEDVYDTVVTRGHIKETNKRSIRLDKTAKIENVYVAVGDYVDEGTILIDVSENEGDLTDIAQVSRFLPEINDISDITDFYIPKKMDNLIELTPQIKSPISGVVTNLEIKAGEVALGQLPIITISNFDDLCIVASVSELNIKDIAVGQKAEITGEAFSGRKYIAYITEISPTATQKTTLTGVSETSIDVTMAFASKPIELRPGYSVNARIFTKSHKDATTIPYTCIFQENDKEYVYKLSGDTIEKKAIKTGFELEDRVEVRSGIEKNDLIVNNPSDKLSDNMSIRIGTS